MKSQLEAQLTLGVQLNDDATFDNFWFAENSPNQQVLAALQDLSRGAGEESFIYLWGASASGGSGLSHLLQAVCRQAEQKKRSCQYLPLSELADYPPDALFESLAQIELLCLDDSEAVLGKPDWDEALFHLYNRAREQGVSLLLTANCAPQELPQQYPSLLPDLASRLSWGTGYRVEGLTDEEKVEALQWRANKRGMEMSHDVARYLINHSSRSSASLFATLDKLDRLSLAEKRKLTVPFVRKLI